MVEASHVLALGLAIDYFFNDSTLSIFYDIWWWKLNKSRWVLSGPVRLQKGNVKHIMNFLGIWKLQLV